MLIYVLPLEIKPTVDKKTREITNLQLLLKELSPTNAPVKVFGQPVSVLNELQAYIDAEQPIALPIRQGTLDNGNVWRGLDDADILPVSKDFVRKKQLEEYNRLKAILFPDSKIEDLPDFPTQHVKAEQTEAKQQHQRSSVIPPSPSATQQSPQAKV